MNDVDTYVANQIADALLRHHLYLQKSGGGLHPAVIVWANLATLAAKNGQQRPDSHDFGIASDDEHVIPSLMTYRTAGADLELSERSIRRLVSSGELKTVRVGGAIRIRREDLESFKSQLTPSGKDGEA